MGANEKKSAVKWTYWLFLAIGLGFMLLFPRLKPFSTITPVGMTVLGVFIGMVFLWSTMDSIWPSLLGLLLVALAGYLGEDFKGYAAVKEVFLQAIGSETVIVCLLGMILFGGVSYVGGTKYMARFFMSRKILEGRPYVFLFLVFLCSFFLGGLTQPIASMLILWPLAIEICDKTGYKKGDKVFYILICGIYLASTLGQPMLPFKGAPYIIISAFEKVTGLTVNFGNYIAYNLIMSMILLVLFILYVKFIVRPDVTGLKEITVEDLTKEKLPPMNMQQKAFFIMLALLCIALVIPAFLPKTFPGIAFINKMGNIGIFLTAIIIMMIVPFEGKPILPFKAVAQKNVSWDILFLVAAAIYVCNCMTADVTGIKPFLVSVLQPMLGGKPDLVFVFLLLAFAIITTNFANNAGMAVVLMPVILAFSTQYPGVNLTALGMSVTMMVFVALLTPAASPYCGMLHARKDLVSYKEIMSLFIPMFLIALAVYATVGYGIACVLF